MDRQQSVSAERCHLHAFTKLKFTRGDRHEKIRQRLNHMALCRMYTMTWTMTNDIGHMTLMLMYACELLTTAHVNVKYHYQRLKMINDQPRIKLSSVKLQVIVSRDEQLFQLSIIQYSIIKESKNQNKSHQCTSRRRYANTM